MDALQQFSLPIKGLRDGFSEYEFQINRDFFNCFEDSLIENGAIDVQFTIEKRPDFFELMFDLKGTVKANCDRCLTEIDLPIESEERLLLKYSEQEMEEELEVIYVSPDASHFNIAKYIYEFISLSVPMVKIYDCQADEPIPCDQEMLKRLQGPEESKSEENDNPAWDSLKNIKF